MTMIAEDSMATRHPVVAKLFLRSRNMPLAAIMPRARPRFASDIHNARERRLAPNSASKDVALPNSPPTPNSLNGAEENQEYRRRNAYRCIARKQDRQTRAGSHDNNVYQERKLAPGPITKVAENEGTE